MGDSSPIPEEAPPEDADRRGFLAGAASLAMLGGLAAGYGVFAALAGRYLYPSKPQATRWFFVARVKGFKNGEALDFKTPAGAGVTIARQGESGTAEDFIALSSVCPHLGCRVHWETQNNRFFCPCHNGVFDPQGMGTEGPPKGQALPRYPLRIENGLLFIEVPA